MQPAAVWSLEVLLESWAFAIAIPDGPIRIAGMGKAVLVFEGARNRSRRWQKQPTTHTHDRADRLGTRNKSNNVRDAPSRVTSQVTYPDAFGRLKSAHWLIPTPFTDPQDSSPLAWEGHEKNSASPR